jgi:hypothetical protein
MGTAMVTATDITDRRTAVAGTKVNAGGDFGSAANDMGRGLRKSGPRLFGYAKNLRKMSEADCKFFYFCHSACDRGGLCKHS